MPIDHPFTPHWWPGNEDDDDDDNKDGLGTDDGNKPFWEPPP